MIRNQKFKVEHSFGSFSYKIDKGTVLQIDQVETLWDFENGYRFFINGSVVYDSKPTPFIYIDSFSDEASRTNHIKNTFESC